MENNDIELLARTSESAKQAHKRIDSLENKVEDIRELACSVKEIATEMKAMREDMSDTKKDVSDIGDRVKVIEEKPARDYEDTRRNIRNQILSFIVGGILTALGLIIFK